MTTAIDESAFPSLFAHVLRKEWGVGILAGEIDGKRRYLFEDGAERTLADGFYQMMHRVEQPNPSQQATYTRLRRALAKRNRDTSGTKDPETTLLEQIAKLRETYPAGLSDPKWAALRGEEAASRAPRHRQPAIDEAREQLSLQALDALLSKQLFSQVWDRLVDVLRRTDLVPAAQLKLKAPSADQQRALALAVRELLHGNGPYETRFDRFLAAFVTAFGQHAKWELATAPSALVHAKEHVSVEPTTFRKQFKLSGSTRSVSTQPSSSAYNTFLGTARLVASKLSDHGEVPRDLLDVRDFVTFTLKSVPRARPVGAGRKASDTESLANAADSETDAD